VANRSFERPISSPLRDTVKSPKIALSVISRITLSISRITSVAVLPRQLLSAGAAAFVAA
jgi:hypothetical protein